MDNYKKIIMLFLFLTQACWALAGSYQGNAIRTDGEKQAEEALDSYYKNLRRLVRESDQEEIDYSARLLEANSKATHGTWINVDTRDKEACRQVYEAIRRAKSPYGKVSRQELCRLDERNPMVSILVFEEINKDEFVRELDLSKLKSTEQSIGNDTRNLAITMAGLMGLFWMLPESVTKWDKEEIRNTKGGMFANYVENLKKGPVVDKDEWYFNYIGHPVSGAAYYVMARHNNLSVMQSFGYSVIMSTFFWEYGFEAFAEIPSIQDLIITPVIGSLMGELFYRAEMSIRNNDSRLLGSRFFGKLAMVVLNPMGHVSTGINKLLGSQVVQSAHADLILRPHKNSVGILETSRGAYIGFQVRFNFW